VTEVTGDWSLLMPSNSAVYGILVQGEAEKKKITRRRRERGDSQRRKEKAPASEGGRYKCCGGNALDYRSKLVEPMGFEPTTSSMPSRRAPSCATAPPKERIEFYHRIWVRDASDRPKDNRPLHRRGFVFFGEEPHDYEELEAHGEEAEDAAFGADSTAG
jgi:hypothetical protein